MRRCSAGSARRLERHQDGEEDGGEQHHQQRITAATNSGGVLDLSLTSAKIASAPPRRPARRGAERAGTPRPGAARGWRGRRILPFGGRERRQGRKPAHASPLARRAANPDDQHETARHSGSSTRAPRAVHRPRSPAPHCCPAPSPTAARSCARHSVQSLGERAVVGAAHAPHQHPRRQRQQRHGVPEARRTTEYSDISRPSAASPRRPPRATVERRPSRFDPRPAQTKERRQQRDQHQAPSIATMSTIAMPPRRHEQDPPAKARPMKATTTIPTREERRRTSPAIAAARPIAP